LHTRAHTRPHFTPRTRSTRAPQAQFLAGLALLERGDAPAAAARLARALEDARESGASLQDDIWRELCRAKYEAWRRDAAARAAARQALLARCEAALLREGERLEAAAEADAAADAAEAAAAETAPAAEAAEAETMADYASCDVAMASAPSPSTSPRACALALVPTPPVAAAATTTGGHLPDAASLAAAAASLAAAPPSALVAALRRVFDAADAADAGGSEAPAELCCPLTLDVFRDPVLAPCSGHSYERSAVLEHLGKVRGRVGKRPRARARARGARYAPCAALRKRIAIAPPP
jgi:hypothetical protein